MGKNDVQDLILGELKALRADVQELREQVAGYKGALFVAKWIGGISMAGLWGWVILVSKKVGIFVY